MPKDTTGATPFIYTMTEMLRIPHNGGFGYDDEIEALILRADGEPVTRPFRSGAEITAVFLEFPGAVSVGTIWTKDGKASPSRFAAGSFDEYPAARDLLERHLSTLNAALEPA